MLNSILCRYLSGRDFPSVIFENRPPSALIDRYWDGRKAPQHLETEVRCAWNEKRFYFQFSAPFADLYVNEEWSREESVYGLWERDVVEVFLRPEISEAYFEFEVSPLSQWLDTLVRRPRKDVDFGWRSGLKVQSEIDSQRKLWTAGLTIPTKPMMDALRLRSEPKSGDIWKTNLFRVSGNEPSREYLTWQPTFTTQPDFHVPEAFGNLILVE
ncbi:MAG TPA: carbohydrate-binding family 9-like protein [Acidobacteriota bacterium]|jgi:hypothetical protein